MWSLRLALVFTIICTSGRSLAQGASAPAGGVDRLISDVLGKLASRDSLSFEVTFRQSNGEAPGAPPETLNLKVFMAKEGRFSVRVTCAGRDLGGVCADGQRITEWDARSRKWTCYPGAAPPGGGPPAPLLIADKDGSVHVSFPLSRYMGSWLSTTSPYEWFFQRLHLADKTTASVEEVNGTRCRVLEAMQAKRAGPVEFTYKVRCLFDEETLLPISEEVSTSAAPPFSGSSSYSFEYRFVTTRPTESLDWQPPADYTFVEPASLRPATPAIVGKSLADWKVRALDGADITLLAQPHSECTLVVVWATWCLPCAMEIETLDKLSKSGELKDVRVVTISIDRDLETLQGFVKTERIPFTIGHDREFLDKIGAPGVPTTVVLDRSGTVREMWTGWGGTDDDVRRLRSVIGPCTE